jgi:OCT family organic cation transporter-like MFS transporter 4/5
MNFILGCLIEIPGNTIAWVGFKKSYFVDVITHCYENFSSLYPVTKKVIMNKLGRRFSLSSSLLLCGIATIAGGFIPEKVFWIQITLFLLGKMAITSSFTIVFVYSGDAFYFSENFAKFFT